MWELMEDLGDMGERNTVIGRSVPPKFLAPPLMPLSRRPFIHRDTLAAAAAIYKGSSPSALLGSHLLIVLYRTTRQ